MSLRGRHGPHGRSGRALARLLAGACTAALMAPPAVSAAQPGTRYPASAPGAACANSGASAQNQYCEDIPGASGSQTPGSGGPTLGATLPGPARARLVAGATGGPVSAGHTATSGEISASASAAVPAAQRAHASRRAAVNALLQLPAASRWSWGSAPAASASAIAPFTWLVVTLAALGLGAALIVGIRRPRTPTA